MVVKEKKKYQDVQFDTVVLDMDGVITKTATVHARAWKEMFDAFLKKKQGEDFKPLDIEKDYNEYIDGKPRKDGIRSFLASREISLPEGDANDDPDKETIHGLAKRKNKIFLDEVKNNGVAVYEDTVEMLKIWKSKNKKLAVISSSRNCAEIIERAGLTAMFEVRVDGVTSEENNLKGKPAPDIFLKATEKLGAQKELTIVIEDALSGVQAGKKGKFALVVGVNRNGKSQMLKKAGADIVVKKLTELKNILNGK